MIPARIRAALRDRADGCCELCHRPATNAHHRRNRSQGGRDVLSNLLLVCGSGTTGCHGDITHLPKWATEFGYTIQGTTSEPWEVPVLLWGRSPYTACDMVMLDDEGGRVSVVTEPDDPRIGVALGWSCDVCGAGVGVMCRNTIRDEPLPERLMHSARLVDRRA